MSERIDQDYETSTLDRERWTAVILGALHAMRRASETGLARHIGGVDSVPPPGIASRSSDAPPPPPSK